MSAYCVVKELDKPERKLWSKKFRETFKTITCDNGCENLDFEGIEYWINNYPRRIFGGLSSNMVKMHLGVA